MKVILVDNYDRDYISDRVHVVDVSPEEANRIADEYNKSCFHWFARAVPDDYQLFEFKP